ncbi:DUF4267 domain-containing protein [Streptacidiphilus neutrinimicus]|uniref:DUF4267 domain-containing protein n=1 Tax=Streptacidiphilus neutrinimicus TaxID=105420 RepID=UPI0005A9B2CA|nr:DUF4267 domain-containing protein [Streptacidiphilus neutrinimicus]
MPTAVTTVAVVLAWVVAVGITFIGARNLWTPQGAVDFGIPGTRPEDASFRAWLRVKADRDIGAGLVMAVVLIGGSAHLIGWFTLVGAVMPLCDALIVRRSGGSAPIYLGVHGATAAVMVAAGALLALS